MKRHLLSFWQSTFTQNAVAQCANLLSQPYVCFVPAGSVPRRPDRYQTHSSNLHNRHPMSSSKALLLNANDWEFLFDLGDSQLVFPSEIAVIIQRHDIVIFSRSKEAVLLIELTVPPRRPCHSWAHPEKKIAMLLQQCSENGWFSRCFEVEVGCLGYVSLSLLHCLESLGIPSSTSRKLRNECSRVARRCSYVLFLRRKCTEWSSSLVKGLTQALYSTRPTPSLRLVQSIVCSLFSVQSYLWILVRSAAADSRSQCADASRSK